MVNWGTFTLQEMQVSPPASLLDLDHVQVGDMRGVEEEAGLGRWERWETQNRQFRGGGGGGSLRLTLS